MLPIERPHETHEYTDNELFLPIEEYRSKFGKLHKALRQQSFEIGSSHLETFLHYRNEKLLTSAIVHTVNRKGFKTEVKMNGGRADALWGKRLIEIKKHLDGSHVKPGIKQLCRYQYLSNAKRLFLIGQARSRDFTYIQKMSTYAWDEFGIELCVFWDIPKISTICKHYQLEDFVI